MIRLRRIMAMLEIVGLLSLSSACSKEEASTINSENNSIIQKESESQVVEECLDYTVLENINLELTIILPNDYEWTDDQINYINYQLYEKGADYKIDIVSINASQYDLEYVELTKNYLDSGGKADLIFTGADSYYTRHVTEFIQSGVFMELNEMIENADLYNLYDLKLWNSVLIEDKIYTVPNEKFSIYTPAIIFNLDYIDEISLDAYMTNGTLDINKVVFSLEDIYDTNSTESTIPNVYLEPLADYVTAFFGMTDIIPLQYVVNERKTVFPLESSDTERFVRELNNLYQKDILDGEFLNEDSEVDRDSNVLETGDFSIYIGNLSENYDDKNYMIARTPLYLDGRHASSFGIYNNSENIQSALDFLYLSRVDVDIANAIIYGEEGKDYQMIDDFACDLEGNYLNPFYQEMIFGIYDKAKRSIYDYSLNTNKIEYRKEMMKNAFNSELAGFVSDIKISEEVFDEISLDVEEFKILITAKDTDQFVKLYNDMKNYSSEAFEYKSSINLKLDEFFGSMEVR